MARTINLTARRARHDAARATRRANKGLPIAPAIDRRIRAIALAEALGPADPALIELINRIRRMRD
jgi:hypothetical protein